MSTDEDHSLHASIGYAGMAGSSGDCVNGILRFLQFGDVVTHARLLTCGGRHGFLLSVGAGDAVAVKCGFTSGYGGEGPSALSLVLILLESHSAEIEEYKVASTFLDRLDASALLKSDIDALDQQRPIGTTSWRDYINPSHQEQATAGTLWNNLPFVMPYAVLDPRLIDLALTFWAAPDERLLTAYRRLEDIVRVRTDSHEHAGKLFAAAFMGDKAAFTWSNAASPGERAGRADLFRATFAAFRNARAHRLVGGTESEKLAEFLLVNQLYRLERDAVPSPQDPGTQE